MHHSFDYPEGLALKDSTEGSWVTSIQSLIKCGFEFPNMPTYPKFSMIFVNIWIYEREDVWQKVTKSDFASSTWQPIIEVSSKVRISLSSYFEFKAPKMHDPSVFIPLIGNPLSKAII